MKPEICYGRKYESCVKKNSQVDKGELVQRITETKNPRSYKTQKSQQLENKNKVNIVA